MHRLAHRDHRAHIRAQYIREELQRVAEALELDPQRVQLIDLRFLERGFVGAHALVTLVDQARNQMPHLERDPFGRIRQRQTPFARLVEELIKPPHKFAEVSAVQIRDQGFARRLLLDLPHVKNRCEGHPWMLGLELLRLLNEHV